jgi:L-cysteine:1D-myo-inositol 2-amino-2-deoxy-alpha-D-glucopyranoside ligase
MRAWPSAPVPSLARLGAAPVPRVHDSARGVAVPSTGPTSPEGTARLYVCGITPYDATHLGHAATYLAFDLLNRAWRDAGHEVTYVQNVTDVDDPLLERAEATGEDWRALADREIERFRGDMEALRVLPPDHYVGAVESIPLVVEAVQGLIDRGQAYDVDGDWYFSVHADPAFGAVSGLSEAEMPALFAERGGDPEREGKKHPLDCLLWRAERAGEPSWESPWGPGRPGWHIECSAIAARHLGVAFDVQGGGSDLAFPHHEMSASEAHALDSSGPFAHAYVHAGMVAFEGEKMSKSRGNLVFVSRLREQGTDPQHIRVALLGHHYRDDWEWFDTELDRAATRLATWRKALPRTSLAEAERLVTEVRDALADDLDAPRALDLLDAWAGAASAHDGDEQGSALVRDLVDARLGIDLG